MQGIDLLFLSGYSNDTKEGVDTNVLDKMQQLRKARPIYMKLDKVKAFKVQPFGTWCLSCPGMIPTVCTLGACRRLVRLAFKFTDAALERAAFHLGDTEVCPVLLR